MHRSKAILFTSTALLAACAIGTTQGTRTKGGLVHPDSSELNPFKESAFFVNPEYRGRVLQLAAKFPAEAEAFTQAAEQPTAVWIDSIASIGKVIPTLDQAKEQQVAKGKPMLSVFVVYDMPNRDCAAEASNGELQVEQNGEARYQREFIDPIAALFQARPDQPIAVVLEPDSLANLATNMALPKCKASRSVYKDATVYAIRKLALPNVSIYLDAAHAGWLGWDDNRNKIAKVYKQVLSDAGGPHMVRGFATNVSNYGHLTNKDLAKLEPSNPCQNELDYVRLLRETLSMYGIKDKPFIVDTSRNGRGNLRGKSGYWCNLRGAGLGERPVADPLPGIDAYFWLKVPGESDGISDPTQPRYDAFCSSPDSVKNAPQAGQWFESYFIDLVHNAEPPF